jgi:tetratricopeptide (TPR) repeat protein
MSKRKNESQADDQVVDAVEVKGSNVLERPNFLEANQKMITYILGGILGLATLWTAWKYLYKEPQEKDALNAMFKAETLFSQDSFAIALESKNNAYEGFLSIIDNYGSTKAGNLAKYYAGVSYLNLGKFDDAINYLEDYSAGDEVTASMKAGGLGDAYSEKGDKEKALSFYSKAAEIDNDLIKPYYLNKLALFSHQEGKKDEAIKHLKELIEKYPDSPEGRSAEQLIARIQ